MDRKAAGKSALFVLGIFALVGLLIGLRILLFWLFGIGGFFILLGLFAAVLFFIAYIGFSSSAERQTDEDTP